MHYLVTGGCGFIGTHLVRALAHRGHRVTILDDLSTGLRFELPEGVDMLEASILDAHALDAAMVGKDGCFHLAAIPSVERCRKEWRQTSAVNVMGTVAVFEAARKRPQPVPVVFASSAAVYGITGENPIDEATPTHPISSYGVDKLTCELYGKIAWESYSVPNIGLRFFNVYGAGQRADSPYSGVITIFAQSMLAGKPITVYGDGEQTRDFIYVDDVVHALCGAMEYKGMSHHVFNVCTGKAVSLNHVIGQLAQAARTSVNRVDAPARIGDIRHSVGVPAALQNAVALPPQAGISAGLKRLLYVMQHGA